MTGPNLDNGEHKFDVEISFDAGTAFEVEIGDGGVFPDSSRLTMGQIESQWHEARHVMERLLREI